MLNASTLTAACCLMGNHSGTNYKDQAKVTIFINIDEEKAYIRNKLSDDSAIFR